MCERSPGRPAVDQTRSGSEATAATFAAESLAAVVAAGRQAVLENKRAGITMVEWRDGRLVYIPPDEIQLPELPDASPPAGHCTD
ncbi:MAG: hypothetical protein HQL66_10015 [Magnetococcales bacterium]|nr:hypothetical protein [Magnetococcales bacterium]